MQVAGIEHKIHEMMKQMLIRSKISRPLVNIVLQVNLGAMRMTDAR